ncbi:hypothetical protein D3C77_660990 [compost metagenome]
MLMRTSRGANSCARVRTWAASAALLAMYPASPGKLERIRKLPMNTTEAGVANWPRNTARVFSAPAPLTAHCRLKAARSRLSASSAMPALGTR